MDDLVEHFSGLGPEDISPPPLHHPQLGSASAEPPHVDVSLSSHAPRSPTPTATPTPITQLKHPKPSSSILQPPITSTRSTSGLPSTSFGGDGTMDLDTYRELFRRQGVPPAATVYGGSESRSSAYGTNSTDYHGDDDDNDDDDEGDYIRHFEDEDEDEVTQPTVPASHLPRNLLNDLKDLNNESDTKHEAGSEEDHPSRDGAWKLDALDLERGSVLTEHHLHHGDSETQEPVEQVYFNNNTKFDEQDRVLDHPSSDNEGTTRSINGTNEMTDLATAPAATQAVSEPDGFTQRLRELHRQDMARDELLLDLHREVQDLRQALKAEARGSQSGSERPAPSNNDARTAAAEQSLIEARQEMEKKPFVCVLIDGDGYDFHEDLLQAGQAGGVEAAERLFCQIQDHLAGFSNAQHWDIMVFMYIDVEGLLARLGASGLLLIEPTLRDFMRGFTQPLVARLFNIIDIGQARKNMRPKVEETFHLFANNVHCKRIFFGCCHDSSYAMALITYTGNPLIALRITLLVSGENDTYYNTVGYEMIELTHVFRPVSFSAQGVAPCHDKDTEDIQLHDSSSQLISRTPSTSLDEASVKAVADWQEVAKGGNDGSDLPKPGLTTYQLPKKQTSISSHHSNSSKRSIKQKKTVLLNINDERVDPPPKPEDWETRESMLDRIEEKKYCASYHLRGKCVTQLLGKVCRFRHEPALNKQEHVVLETHLRGLACDSGSSCRYDKCLHGHVCHSQPNCQGARCKLYKFHGVDPTAVKVWRP